MRRRSRRTQSFALAPPRASDADRLDRAVARITSGRLARIRRRLGAIPVGRRLARLAAEAAERVRALPTGPRRRLLRGPDLRGFLSEAETWTEVAGLARIALHRRGIGGAAAMSGLFDRIGRTEHLIALVPRGRVDPALPARALRFAGARLRALEGDLGAFLLGLRLAFDSVADGGAPLRLRSAAEPEQGRPAHRIDLGTFGGPAGALGIEMDGRRAAGRAGARRLTARLRRGALVLDGAAGTEVFPAAASPWRFPSVANGRGRAPAGLRLVRRRSIPGTTIVLAPTLVSTPRRLAVGDDVPGLEARLAKALRLVRLAWPEAHDAILSRTAMVVPVRETGLVSYSLAARPGVSFVNFAGKSTVDLADDLLHETAHHLLHDLQEIADLLVPGPDTEEVQAFDSPWRGARRPLHGLLHGAYTFHFRAELFARLIEAGRRLPRVVGPLLGRGGAGFLRRELRRELAMTGRALSGLEAGARAGLLTPAGRALARSLAAWRRRLVAHDRRLNLKIREPLPGGRP